MRVNILLQRRVVIRGVLSVPMPVESQFTSKKSAVFYEESVVLYR